MKKQTLSLIGIAAAALFAAGVQAQGGALQTDRSFDFHNFYNGKATPEAMVSKDQYMKEMERRWMMADKMMGDKAGKGWVSHSNLMKAMKEPPVASGGAQ